MNPGLNALQPYPFERLAHLLEDVQPPASQPTIALTVGEPKHEPPAFVVNALRNALPELSRYPTTSGLPELREACANWIRNRFHAKVNPATQLLPVNGTREALFAFAQCVINPADQALIAMPNPCYQIYEGAALLAGAEPWFCPNGADLLPDLAAVPEAVWQRCKLFYLCSPGNPTGSVWSRQQLRRLLELADQHGFIIAADECYSEIYVDQPPPGLLEVCAETGRDDFSRCMVFHSLSKRSNLPGLRSGFVAGDATLIRAFLSYRTYHGCAMSIPNQLASIAAWADESHVEHNRVLYREKFAQVTDILGDVLPVSTPDGSFYLWPETPIDDREFARSLYAKTGVKVLPGRFLSRAIDGTDPGANRVRISLVAALTDCVAAAKRIRDHALSLQSAAI